MPTCPALIAGMIRRDVRAIQDILAAHADALNRGQRALPTLPDAEAESLRSLMAVAELVQGILTPVQPNPDFVRRLGKSLLVSARRSRQALTARTRRAALIGAAVLGSLASAASIVGVIVYVLRRRAHLRAA